MASRNRLAAAAVNQQILNNPSMMMTRWRLHMSTNAIDQRLALVNAHYPELAVRRARLLPNSGQFNHVLCLNERWIFRFP